MKIGDLVYRVDPRLPKVLGIIIECDYANSFDDGAPEPGDMWYYKVKWLDSEKWVDSGRVPWYDMEEVETAR